MSAEKIKPYKDSSLDKKQQIARMFNNIAVRYDFLNHFLSFGIDRYWRRRAISMLESKKNALILDIATGTSDLAIEAVRLKPAKIFGVDISSEMLDIGRKKIQKKNLQDIIQLLEGDSEDLIFEDNKFDAVTVGFGVRNFQSLEEGLIEMRRVLKPGGIVVILEFSQPKNPLLNKLYNFYSSKITPGIGSVISKDGAAYSYLHESVKAFPHGIDFCNILVDCGYRNIHFTPLTFGIVTIYTAEK
jgi:demethylmenaquinone methyltransferase/2-methoxy-6-polyprenyl-1,4-benzoquinol methylase